MKTLAFNFIDMAIDHVRECEFNAYALQFDYCYIMLPITFCFQQDHKS